VVVVEALATDQNLRREATHPTPEENTKRIAKTQAFDGGVNAFSMCLIRTELPSMSTPITSKR